MMYHCATCNTFVPITHVHYATNPSVAVDVRPEIRDDAPAVTTAEIMGMPAYAARLIDAMKRKGPLA